MTIRWKLNLTVAALIVTFLAAIAVVVGAVRENAEITRRLSEMRELSEFATYVRTVIFERLALESGAVDPAPGRPVERWPDELLDDVEIQIRLAEDEASRSLWVKVSEAVSTIGDRMVGRVQQQEALRAADTLLRQLHNLYDAREHGFMARAAETSLHAQRSIWAACLLTVLLFLLYLIMVRHWLVRPIRVLKESADAIGRGDLEFRVPLEGRDELTQLARRLDAMAESLAHHQSALIEARELSAIGELCTNVAHGLKNPLAAMRAGAQLAARRAGDIEPLRTKIRELIEQADRMDERITRLFEFSRTIELRPARVTFSEIAEQARRLAAPLAETRGVRIEVDDQIAAAVWAVDPEKIGEALGEVLTNAVHHSPPQGKVTLAGRAIPSANRSGPRLEIQVNDRGHGMSEPTRRKAFDLFFTTRPNGTGMGLAMVRRIVERHGGTIELESEPTVGTTVTIVLPNQPLRNESPANGNGTRRPAVKPLSAA